MATYNSGTQARRHVGTKPTGRVLFIPIVLCVLCVSAVSLSGCALLDQHARDMDIMRSMAETAANRLANGSIGQFQVGGQAINPGVDFSFTTEYHVRGAYTGLSGQFMAGGSGQLAENPNPSLTENLATATQGESLGHMISKAVDAELARRAELPPPK